jgi:hypothetical protein
LGFVTALGILASASAATALSFTFSFSNTDGSTPGTVSGTIDGLSIGSNGSGSPVVTVTSSPLGGLGTYTFAFNIAGGDTFTVDGSGNITYADWIGNLGGYSFSLGTNFPVTTAPQHAFSLFNNVGNSNSSTLTFTPATTAVPFEFTPSLGIVLVFAGGGSWHLIKKQLKKKKQ